MSRKKRVYKHKMNLGLDPLYNDYLVTKLINKVLLKGKKSLARKIVYKSLEIVSEKCKKEPLEAFKKALDNVKPLVEVRSRKIGGSNYQVPVELSEKRQSSLMIRWLVEIARKRNGKGMINKLAFEIIDAYNKTGKMLKKQEEIHKMAEANKAFSYFKW